VKKINFLLLIVGIFVIIVSTLNFLMNEDHVSLGIFVFTGIGFILLSLKGYFKKESENRIQKYSISFFFLAIMLFLYWVIKVQFGII